MANMAVENQNIGGIFIGKAVRQDEKLTFTGAGTILAGTILARDSVSLKLVPYVKGGSTNGNGIPKAIVDYDVTATGAGDISIRAVVTAHVRKGALIIAADGDDSNIDAAVLDQLRDYGIVASAVTDLSILDNQ